MGPHLNPQYNQMSVTDDCILVDNRLAATGQLSLRWLNEYTVDTVANNSRLAFRFLCVSPTCIKVSLTEPRTLENAPDMW